MKEHLYIRNFIKKDQPKKDNSYPLMVVLHTPKCKVSLSVKCSVKLSDWNATTTLPEGDLKALKQLRELRKTLLSIYQIHKLDGKTLTAKEVKELYISNKYQSTEAIYESPKKVNRTTLLQQEFSNILEQFFKRAYKLYKIDYAYLPSTLWQDFKTYIKNKHYRHYDSCLYFIGRQLLKLPLNSKLKTIIKTHLKGFKSVLNPSEINNLIRFNCGERLSKIRNAFIFALHTGLSFDIIKTLTRANYRKTITDEDFLLVRNQHKQLQWIDINSLPKIIQDCCLRTEQLLFPLPSIQKTNAYLKELAESCTDAKYLSFYSAVLEYKNA